MPLNEILTRDSSYTSSGRLRKRLLRAGMKEALCESCGLREWQGEPIQLELDHIDGDRSNNTLANLRMLCPNCHAQTETWCRQKPT
jgi:5-methylcytosine-specific restriction endonuclease McrA